MTDAQYAFGNALDIQRARLAALETLLDPGTIAQLERRGVQADWDCLEAGAGGGSIAAWLGERARAVVATDLDVSVLTERDLPPNVEVRRHDLLADPLPAATFDLVHARLLVAWLPDPVAGLRHLAAALKPGGWLVSEELDFISVAADPRLPAEDREPFERVARAHTAVLAELSGFDAAYGRRLADDVAGIGLEDTGAEGRVAIWRGAQAGGDVWRLTLAQLREPMIASGRVSAGEVDRAVALCAEPRLGFVSPITMTAWGRAPGGRSTRT